MSGQLFVSNVLDKSLRVSQGMTSVSCARDRSQGFSGHIMMCNGWYRMLFHANLLLRVYHLAADSFVSLRCLAVHQGSLELATCVWVRKA